MLVHTEIIGAHDQEGHSVFDSLFNNTTHIHPTVHATDTPGTNAGNFAILHLFGYRFAPRSRAIYDKGQKALSGFPYPAEMVLRPIRKLSPKLISDEWDTIRRLMVALALKTPPQSILVRNLRAFARTNTTRRALWASDNIIRSLSLLDSINAPPLRQQVQRPLNRGEKYHQLRRAVSHANFGTLRFKTEPDPQSWGECARLLTTCILDSNARLLSQGREAKEAAGDPQGAALLSQVSPVAWQHLNFYERCEFRNGPERIAMEESVQHFAQVPVRQILAG